MSVPMSRSGFCAFESPGSHAFCHQQEYRCDCPCHDDPALRGDIADFGRPRGSHLVELDDEAWEETPELET